MHIVKSSVPGYRWPALPAHDASAMLAMQFQLEQSQWLSPEELLELQLLQLGPLVNHAYKSIDCYAEKYRNAGLKPDQKITRIDQWRQIPIITRSEIQQAGELFVSSDIPPSHGPVAKITTSGSTGKPIVISSTPVTGFFWNVFTLREHLWYKRDFSRKLGVIRWLDAPEKAMAPDGLSLNGWGKSTDVAYQTGPLAVLNLRCSIREQYEWLKRENPDYLLTYATNALELAKYFNARGETLSNLKQIRTLSETVSQELREACREVWGAEVADMYSARECGYLALQCPGHDHYHVQSENVLIEILDEQGNPCSAGEVGRVIVSTLHNYASPLLRYDIGDYAEVGEPCPCGRGLPVLKRIAGRVRNMLTTPTGERFWPIILASRYSSVAPIMQTQFIQRVLDRLEIRMVLARPLTAKEESELTLAIHESMGYPFELDFVPCKSIERSSGGKYEEFISMLDAPES